MAIATRWTADLVRALPDDGNRYEVVDGVLLVTPAPAGVHQFVLSRLFTELALYLRPLSRSDTLLWSPADISWAEDVLVQPDIFVMDRPMVRGWEDAKNLLLAVEALSPSTKDDDRGRKRLAYQRFGVETYWVVDHEAGQIEVWHPGDTQPTIVRDVLHWQVTPEAPTMTIQLRELFTGLPTA